MIPPPIADSNLHSAIKSHYRSGLDDLGTDFFGPCFAACKQYRRASGYFSSGALLMWAEGLKRLGHEKELDIKLIASPEIQVEDHALLERLDDPEERARHQAVLVDQLMIEIIKLSEGTDDRSARAKIFAWLIANNKLSIRFAFPQHIERAGLFHEKIGIFDLDDGSCIAFTGSANETARGHRRNYESVDVFRSWIPIEVDRVATKIAQFDEAWDGRARGLTVLSLSPETLARLKSAGRPPASVAPPPLQEVDSRWRHQEEAVEALMLAKSGILEMATGTGKTRTAIKFMTQLITDDKIDSVIVTTDGTDLLEQWAIELEEWALNEGSRWLIFRQFEKFREAGEYALASKKALIVVSRSQLLRVLNQMGNAVKRRTLIVHDEVHGLGMPSLQRDLAGQHAEFTWKVGLSATPERTYDQEGNKFVLSELGKTVYEFPLERAISRGVLAEFDYLPLTYDLTDGDRLRLQAIYAKKSARLRDGNPMGNEELWTEIARVYKTAEMKPTVFRDFLQEHPETLKRAIIFVETREYGEEILDIIDEHTNRYRTYYAEDERSHLVDFARGGIDCLITCHRISQGIDINSLNTVVLFASARARLETVQRIGRCLRIDSAQPNKRALVVDFVRPVASGEKMLNADQDRAAWLLALSKSRKGDDDGAGSST